MGSGYRVFTAGEVLSASNVQNYLQDQAVMVFSGTAARSSAIGTANFEEGMLTYLTDVDKLQVYTGAAFADVYPAAATNQGLTLISTTSFSGVAGQSINDVFSATYDSYRIIVDAYGTVAGANLLSFRIRVSGSDISTNSYTTNSKFNYSGTATTFDLASGSAATSLMELAYLPANSGDGRTTMALDIHNPFTAFPTTIHGTGTGTRATIALTGAYITGQIPTLTSYTGFTIFPGSGTITGRLSVYGYNK